MHSQSASSIVAQPQPQEEQNHSHEFQRFTLLLQIFDEIEINKDLQFRAMSVVNYVLQFHPHFVTEALMPQFAFTFVKLILQKFPLQYGFVSAELQSFLDQVPEDYLEYIDQVFGLVQVGMPQIVETPYSLLKDIKMWSMMSDKTYDQIKLIVDYALTFLEAYSCSAEDVLSACISMYSANHSEALVLLIFLQGSVQENTESLKGIIANGLQHDLLMG